MITMNLSYSDLENSYYRSRKWKRKKREIIQWEENEENNMKELYDDLCKDKYIISPTKRYIIKDPVVREIIVLSFRDRIVQHLVHSYIYPLRDKWFIHDSYSNRLNKWTLTGIKRLDQFMRSCSMNYKKDCYIMKCDIQSCFLSVDKNILREIIINKMWNIDVLRDKTWVLNIINKIIFHDYCKWCIDYTTSYQRWLFPYHKSLLFVPKTQWMPLGNLTSQLFANIYLNELDQFIKHILKIRYYVRYVDDFVLLHHDKNYLLECHEKIKNFLSERLKMTLHPNKLYIQHYKKWVKFLWVMIYPYYRVVWKRIISNWFKRITDKNNSGEKRYQSLMSYNGCGVHHKCYRLRQQWMSSYINSLEE